VTTDVRFGAAPGEDPQVDQAMAVYDNLNATEQREVFRTVYRAVAEYGRTRHVDHLIRLAESVEGMVRIESHDPGAREAIRRSAGSPLPSSAAEGVDLDDVVKELREA
jgi:hypothetical protein